MEELARLLLLLVVAAVLINLLAGGPQRVRQWAAAKFLGRA